MQEVLTRHMRKFERDRLKLIHKLRIRCGLLISVSGSYFFCAYATATSVGVNLAASVWWMVQGGECD